MLVNDDGHVLVLRRSSDDEHNPGHVDFPGGGVEQNESYPAAIVREIEEETGLRLSGNDLELEYAFTRFDETTKGAHIQLLFVAHTHGIDVRLSREHDKYWRRKPQEVDELFETTSWKDAVRFVHKHTLKH